jgi:hypothetical protein
VLVTASRQWHDRQRIRAAWLAVQRRFGAPGAAMGIVHGAARGGDRLAADVVRELGWVRDPVPCTAQEWERYGRRWSRRQDGAGRIRTGSGKFVSLRGCGCVASVTRWAGVDALRSVLLRSCTVSGGAMIFCWAGGKMRLEGMAIALGNRWGALRSAP